VDSFALLLIERLGVRNLEAVFAVLITVMAGSFGVMYVLAGVPTAEVAEGAAARGPASSGFLLVFWRCPVLCATSSAMVCWPALCCIYRVCLVALSALTSKKRGDAV